MFSLAISSTPVKCHFTKEKSKFHQDRDPLADQRYAAELVEENWWKWLGRGAPRPSAAATTMTELEDNDGIFYEHV